VPDVEYILHTKTRARWHKVTFTLELAISWHIKG